MGSNIFYRAIIIVLLFSSSVYAQTETDKTIIPNNTRFNQRMRVETRTKDRSPDSGHPGAIWFNLTDKKFRGDLGTSIFDFGTGGGGTTLPTNCIDSQVLKWSFSGQAWVCANDETATPGSGITTFNNQIGSTQNFANDTNVTITSNNDTHTLGWSGVLSVARGGLGLGTTPSNGQIPVYNAGADRYEPATPIVYGDASTTTSTSVDNEVALFSGTSGKVFKRSALTAAVVKSISGILQASISSDIVSLWTNCTAGYLRYNGVCDTPLLGTANTFTTGLQDFSAVTMKLPHSAGFVSSSSSDVGYDTTGTQWHWYINGNDRVMVYRAVTTPTIGNFACWASNGLLTDTGCTSSGTVTSIIFSSPLTGGTITNSGTVGCPGCVTSAASNASNALMLGAGLQAVAASSSASYDGTNFNLGTGNQGSFRARSYLFYGTNGTDVATITAPTTFTSYGAILPTTNGGTSNAVLLSGTGSGWLWGSRNGTTTVLATVSGSLGTSKCLESDASGNGNIVVAASNAACGAGSGSANWSALLGGTNNSGQAFHIGSSSSLDATGTGTIDATSVKGKDVANIWLGKTVAPTSAENTAAGYLNGDEWFDSTHGRNYYKESESGGTAVWIERLVSSAPLVIRQCIIENDTQSATALTDAQITGNCDVPDAAHIYEVAVYSDGTCTTDCPKLNLQRWRPNGGSTADILSGVLITGTNGAYACARSATSATCDAGITSDSSITLAGAATIAVLKKDVIRVKAGTVTAGAAATWHHVVVSMTLD